MHYTADISRPASLAEARGEVPVLPGLAQRPLGTGSCPCHNAVASSRDLIASLARSTLEATDYARAAITRSATIEWEGKAAEYFHARMNDDAASSVRTDEDIGAMQTMLWQDGAS